MGGFIRSMANVIETLESLIKLNINLGRFQTFISQLYKFLSNEKKISDDDDGLLCQKISKLKNLEDLSISLRGYFLVIDLSLLMIK